MEPTAIIAIVSSVTALLIVILGRVRHSSCFQHALVMETRTPTDEKRMLLGKRTSHDNIETPINSVNQSQPIPILKPEPPKRVYM